VPAPAIAPFSLGAPGVYQVGDRPIRMLTGVRMDVCAFVGVAPRGPARDPYFDETWAPQPISERPRDRKVKLATPVAIESWSAYTRLYGSFEGPSLLPYAVASFFDNGGRRAYIVRIVHQYFKSDASDDDVANDRGIARGAFDGASAAGGRDIWLRARNEGSWGGALVAQLSFTTTALGLDAGDFFVNRIRLPIGSRVPSGTTLRLVLGAGVRTIRRIETIVEDWNPITGTRQLWAWLDQPTAAPAMSGEIVEGTLAVDDGVNPTETLARIGLASNHPRWLAAVLVNESDLLYPCASPLLAPGDPLASWIDADLVIDPELAPVTTPAFSTGAERYAGTLPASLFTGADRYADIIPEDFFDDEWVLGDDAPGIGVHALTELQDLSLVVAPDLYSPGPLGPIEPIVDPPTFSGPVFAECVDPPLPKPQGPPADDLTGLRLDPNLDFDTIVGLQRRVAGLADELESFIVLLDVPPGLSQKRMLTWRAKFDTAYAAAYHPWLDVSRTDDDRQWLVHINPSAVAAGIIAQREALFGVPYGPANVIAAGVVDVDDRVSPARHAELHQNAINVYIRERDGARLTAARTLARDQVWRQLNVRRLITMIRRALERQMQWSVFEPNDSILRAQITQMLDAFLRELYRANAFTGATEDQAYFVACDDALNPIQVEQAGQLIAQVGVAPAEPLEFIVLDLARSGDTILTVEEH
jgi:uncharacterized protein